MKNSDEGSPLDHVSRPEKADDLDGVARGEMLRRHLESEGAFVDYGDFKSRLDLTGAVLDEAQLAKSRIVNSSLRESSFCNAMLYRSDMRNGIFTNSVFVGANLCYCNLEDSFFVEANLRDAEFDGANCRRVNFKGAMLANASLAEADLTGADLSGTCLIGADFDGADISDVKLEGADLQGVKNLSQATGIRKAQNAHRALNVPAGVEHLGLEYRPYQPFPKTEIEELEEVVKRFHEKSEEDANNRDERRQIETKTRALLRKYRSPREGDLILDVEIEELIGEGAYGQVWRGTDPKSKQTLAVKTIKPQLLLQERAFIYFKRGAEAMLKLSAQVDVPSSIVRIVKPEDCLLAYAMPYYSKGHMDLENFDWPTETRLGHFRTICEAVQFAHSHKIIHRDIKPTNILIGANGVPALTDFDIADLQYLQGQTMTGIGVPIYTAPELYDLRKGSPASDIYSLGGILYLLLTSDEPVPFTQQPPSLRELPAHAKVFWSVLSRCLDPSPEKRYQTVPKLVADFKKTVSRGGWVLPPTNTKREAIFVVDVLRDEVRYQGEPLDVKGTPMRILAELALNAPNVTDWNVLEKKVRVHNEKKDEFVEQSSRRKTVSGHIRKLNRALKRLLEQDKNTIRSVHGDGYALCMPGDEVEVIGYERYAKSNEG